VVDTSRGIQWPRWFVGGRMNLTAQCVDVHVAAGHGDKPAVISEAEDGGVRTLTYAELAREVGRLANALTRLGVGPGDTVGIFLPMCQEAAVAVLAVTRIGAVYAPCFSGYGAQAVAARLTGCDAKVLITADAFARRGNVIPMKRTADEAVAESPSVRHVIVHRRTGADIPWTPGRDVWWHEAVATEPAECEALAVEADHPALIIYTSGTTGRPKGTVLTQGGFGIKNAHDWAYVFDMDDTRPDVLGHRPRLAHGADAHHGHAAPRRDGGALRGHARLSEARSPLGALRAPSRHASRHLADGHARAHALRRRLDRQARSLGAPHHRLDGRAVEPRALSLAPRACRRRACADHQLHGRHRDLGRHPRVVSHRAHQAVLLQRADPGDGGRVLRRGRPAGARRGRASSSSRSPGRE
jgi:hypothetical protein